MLELANIFPMLLGPCLVAGLAFDVSAQNPPPRARGVTAGVAPAK